MALNALRDALAAEQRAREIQLRQVKHPNLIHWLVTVQSTLKIWYRSVYIHLLTAIHCYVRRTSTRSYAMHCLLQKSRRTKSCRMHGPSSMLRCARFIFSSFLSYLFCSLHSIHVCMHDMILGGEWFPIRLGKCSQWRRGKCSQHGGTETTRNWKSPSKTQRQPNSCGGSTHTYIHTYNAYSI